MASASADKERPRGRKLPGSFGVFRTLRTPWAPGICQRRHPHNPTRLRIVSRPYGCHRGPGRAQSVLLPEERAPWRRHDCATTAKPPLRARPCLSSLLILAWAPGTFAHVASICCPSGSSRRLRWMSCLPTSVARASASLAIRSMTAFKLASVPPCASRSAHDTSSSSTRT